MEIFYFKNDPKTNTKAKPKTPNSFVQSLFESFEMKEHLSNITVFGVSLDKVTSPMN